MTTSVGARPGFPRPACAAVRLASIGQIDDHIHPRNTAAALIQPSNTPYRHVPGTDTPTPTTIPTAIATSNLVRADAPRRRPEGAGGPAK